MAVVNPASGSEDHIDTVIALADDHDFAVRVTTEAADARRFAADAADGADLVAAVGGDGTVNEVVNGLADASGLGSTVLGVVPAGTGNNFAANVGVDGIEVAFDVMERGSHREIDVGVANGRAFVNSCVGGVTAAASGDTTSEEKREYGVLAYVFNTIERVASFESLPLRAEMAAGPDDDATAWEGQALFVLVGNCRRFGGGRTGQANVEDGLFEVTVVEEAPAADLVEEAALERLFGGYGDHIVARRTPSLSVESFDGPVEYSLDGELLETERLTLETRPAALTVAVGEGYEPNPDGE